MTKKSSYDKQFLDKMHQVLLDEKARLERELSKFAKKNPNVKGDYDASFPEYGDKDDENAQEIAQYTVNKPLEIALEKELRDVNTAMKLFDKGVYGVCKYCDNPIGEKRMKARPTSSSCVACKKTLTQEA